jgi:predicted acylesterase/phospholipase RssA
MQQVKHLVISGGAFKGIAFLGVLECLRRRQELSVEGMETFVGSSVGALLCSLFVVGYTPAQIFRETLETDFAKMLNPDVSKLITSFGVESGEKFIQRVRELFSRKGFDPDITLSTLHRFTGKRLVLTATCLNRGKGVCYFDHINAPDLPVLTGVRMSISIPFVLTAVRWKGEYYVDGGILDNFALSALFPNVNPSTVIAVRSKHTLDLDDVTHEWTMEQFVTRLVKTWMDEVSRLRALLGHDTYRRLARSIITVKTERLQAATKVNLSRQDKIELLREGYQAAIEYLDSDAFLTLQVDQLPYRAMRRVWFEKHKDQFRGALAEIQKDGLESDGETRL